MSHFYILLISLNRYIKFCSVRVMLLGANIEKTSCILFIRILISGFRPKFYHYIKVVSQEVHFGTCNCKRGLFLFRCTWIAPDCTKLYFLIDMFRFTKIKVRPWVLLNFYSLLLVWLKLKVKAT